MRSIAGRLVAVLITRYSSTVVASLVVLVAAGPASAQPDKLLQQLPKSGAGAGLSDVKIGDGLKQALQVATEQAVGLTGKTDGYFANAAIKILMPERLRMVEQGLRAVGQGERIDEFVLGMNRAAERAAPAAKSIFWDAIAAMSFDDARRILQGPNTAATDYFKQKTTDKLTAAFRPVVSSAMDEVGVTRQYKQLVGSAERLPFVNVAAFDVDDYVVGKALDGLFHVVGEEEQKIRTNPTARITPLLKEVFSR
jgi:hypothetical protein